MRSQKLEDRGLDLATVGAISVVVYATAIALHEVGHAMVGALVGGTPTLITSTDVRGDWDAVSRIGFVLLGVSGSVVNWLLLFGGLALLAARPFKTAAACYFAWLLATVNGFVAGVYMIASPLTGFGDWMTILGRFSAEQPLRAVTAVAGLTITLVWARASARWLAPLLVGASATERREYALRLARLSWASGGGLALLAATLSPLGIGRALWLGAGSSIGTTWPLMFVARAAARIEPGEGHGGTMAVGRDGRWLAAAGLVGGAFVIVFGHGLRLPGAG